MFAVGCHEIEQNQGGISGGKNKLWFEKGIFMHARASDFSSGETAWASGGSALFDKAKWLYLGGFDPNFYPAYWEDVDLSYRAKKNNWLVWFESLAVVDHNHESTNSAVFNKTELNAVSWKNGIYFTKKHANFWQKLQFKFWQPYWSWQRNKQHS
jgi:GT2 family glycosyltransferase